MINQLFMIGVIKEMVDFENRDNSYIFLEVKRSYKSSDGVYNNDVFKCYLWQGIYKKIFLYCKEGDLLAVKGRLEEEEGTCNIVLDQVILLNKTMSNS